MDERGDGSAARTVALAGRHPELALLVVIGSILVAGVAFWYYAPLSRFIDVAVADPIPADLDRGGARGPRTFAFGAIRGVAHEAYGGMRMIVEPNRTRTLRLEDLHVANGPALVVGLSSVAATAQGDLFDDGDFYPLADLRGNIGDQNYEIPSVLDLRRFASVVIWSERFGVAYAVSAIRF